MRLKCVYWRVSVVNTKSKRKKQREFSLTAESYDNSWVVVEMDSSKILCLCKHKTNTKLKALVITILENKAEMPCHAPLMRKAIAPWNWNTQEFCLNWNQLRKRWLNRNLNLSATIITNDWLWKRSPRETDQEVIISCAILLTEIIVTEEVSGKSVDDAGNYRNKGYFDNLAGVLICAIIYVFRFFYLPWFLK